MSIQSCVVLFLVEMKGLHFVSTLLTKYVLILTCSTIEKCFTFLKDPNISPYIFCIYWRSYWLIDWLTNLVIIDIDGHVVCRSVIILHRTLHALFFGVVIKVQCGFDLKRHTQKSHNIEFL